MSRNTPAACQAVRTVLNIEAGGAPAFLHRQIFERSLSRTVVELNRDFLSGTPEERELARRALQRLGFTEL